MWRIGSSFEWMRVPGLSHSIKWDYALSSARSSIAQLLRIAGQVEAKHELPFADAPQLHSFYTFTWVISSLFQFSSLCLVFTRDFSLSVDLENQFTFLFLGTETLFVPNSCLLKILFGHLLLLTKVVLTKQAWKRFYAIKWGKLEAK